MAYTKDEETLRSEKALEIILLNRGGTHGPVDCQCAIAQQLKKIMRPHHTGLDHVQIEALDMIALKISRILAGDPNFLDHWSDIAGYATLVANRLHVETEL